MSVSWRDMSDPSTLHELQRWMEGREDEHVEFKAATKSYGQSLASAVSRGTTTVTPSSSTTSASTGTDGGPGRST